MVAKTDTQYGGGGPEVEEDMSLDEALDVVADWLADRIEDG